MKTSEYGRKLYNKIKQLIKLEKNFIKKSKKVFDRGA